MTLTKLTKLTLTKLIIIQLIPLIIGSAQGSSNILAEPVMSDPAGSMATANPSPIDGQISMRPVKFGGIVFDQQPSPSPSPSPSPVPAPMPAVLDSNFASGGISYLPGGAPNLSGTGIYAKLISSSAGTYAFTVVDALPATTKPFTVSTNVAIGIAQKVITIGGVSIFIPTSAGISWTGINTGWAWSTGALAPIPIGKTHWRIAPNVRLLKSSVAGSNYQVIVGLTIGYGW